MTNSGQNTVPAGYVRRAHGIRGDVVVRGLVEDANDRLVTDAAFDTNEDTRRALTVETVNKVGDDFRIHFRGIDDRDTAETLKGVQLMMDIRDRRLLDAGEWWPEDLIGCQVRDIDGSVVGDVIEVILAGVQDRLVVTRSDGARGEIPFVEALVPTVDPDAREITVDLPDGLFE